MNTYHQLLAGVGMCLLAGILGAGSGCSDADAEVVMDAGALLERYERDRRRHDPRHFGEVDLGEFRVTQHHGTSIMFVRFHLFGVLPDGRIDQFKELLQAHEHRVKEKVSEVATRCDIVELQDPNLGWLKSELISSINRIVQAPLLRDVAFAEFSMERG